MLETLFWNLNDTWEGHVSYLMVLKQQLLASGLNMMQRREPTVSFKKKDSTQSPFKVRTLKLAFVVMFLNCLANLCCNLLISSTDVSKNKYITKHLL